MCEHVGNVMSLLKFLLWRKSWNGNFWVLLNLHLSSAPGSPSNPALEGMMLLYQSCCSPRLCASLLSSAGCWPWPHSSAGVLGGSGCWWGWKRWREAAVRSVTEPSFLAWVARWAWAQSRALPTRVLPASSSNSLASHEGTGDGAGSRELSMDTWEATFRHPALPLLRLLSELTSFPLRLLSPQHIVNLVVNQQAKALGQKKLYPWLAVCTAIWGHYSSSHSQPRTHSSAAAQGAGAGAVFGVRVLPKALPARGAGYCWCTGMAAPSRTVREGEATASREGLP